MPSSRDLTSLDNVRAYLGIKDNNSDTLLGRLITAMSNAFAQETSGPTVRQSVSEVLNGNDERVRYFGSGHDFGGWSGVKSYSGWGGLAIDLKYGPVIGDVAVTVDGTVIPKRPTQADIGWVLLDGFRLQLVGYQFTPGVGNVTLAYEVGQFIPAELVTVPAVSPYTIQADEPYGPFISDVSVTKVSDSSLLTKVSGAPATGQYSASSSGLYTFNSAQQGTPVSLSYAYLPSDVEDCVIEMVAFKFRKRERIDQISASIGDQTVSFTRAAWPITVQQVIDRWRRVPI